MATVGLIGGLGPESTIDYYRRIGQVWQQQEPSSSPSMVIDSLDVQRGLQLVANDIPALTDYLFASVRRLAHAGVDFVAMTANTGHIVFDELEERIDGIILGGTELPLLLRAPEIAGLPALDTTALHVDAIVKRLRGS